MSDADQLLREPVPVRTSPRTAAWTLTTDPRGPATRALSSLQLAHAPPSPQPFHARFPLSGGWNLSFLAK